MSTKSRPCIYCQDDSAVQPNCYCRASSLAEYKAMIESTPEFQAEAVAALKVYAAYRSAKQAGDRPRCWALKVAMNYPPRRFTEIATAFRL